MSVSKQILRLFETRGDSQYGRECVTQLQHALQAATMAEHAHESPALIIAALLHDIGHLLHDLPSDAPDRGIDDHHEAAGERFLRHLFPEAVTIPVRLHVVAKRYLCTIEPGYLARLSEPSIVSLNLQGGLMTAEEVANFEDNSFAHDAVLLRRWDDDAKIPDMITLPLEHFSKYLDDVALEDAVGEEVRQ